ncbi:outer membrane protein [Phenylobacterium deserti]|uniref:Outer membrane protein beta-barrel domain-containing protein n=1 Tax=Phenylobacterium deserti TaxID=1914756 RepID=A0A328AWL2_9CAUL|nr:outer membrane beta-barrel protein [Phenylobacterium deserti]RAK58106.1 hypothetical protein DJ018_09420 [Phenylobacterium deserti]
MTKTLLATTAAFALLASATAAGAQTIGHVGANYGRSNVEIDGLGDADADAGQLEGAIRFDAGSLGALIEGAATFSDSDGDDETTLSATGHLNTTISGGLIGGFVGVDHSDDVDVVGGGVEGQFALGASTTLYGQLGYANADDLNVDGWAVRAELRHFYTDNFVVKGSLGALTLDSDFGDADGWTAGVGAEYQFAGTPWSVTGAYEHLNSDDLGLDANTFRIGLRYTFGGTLKARNDAGADLGSVSNLFGGALR